MHGKSKYMRHLFVFVMAAAIVACNITDTRETPKAKEEHEAEAKKALQDSTNYTTIEWVDKVVQDLGSVKKGEVVEITWKFKNTGTKPLIIADAYGSCGCTVAEKPTEPIAPGAESVIKAKFNSSNFSGHVTKDVNVSANNSNRNDGENNRLTFTANIKE